MVGGEPAVFARAEPVIQSYARMVRLMGHAGSGQLTKMVNQACIAGLLWIFFEFRRLGLRFFWIYIILAFGVAYAFAFPLFLFVRQGKLESMQNEKN